MISLAEILKERRKTKGLTLRRVSEMSGVHPSHIARIERGERFPSGHILHKLAKPLGFGEAELFKLAGFMSQDSTDDRIDKFKGEIKAEIIKLLEVIDKWPRSWTGRG